MYHHTPVYTDRPLGQLRPLTLLVAGILLSQVTPAGAATRGVSNIENIANITYNIEGEESVTNSRTSIVNPKLN